MTETPCIICVAITGSLPTKENNPAVPITVAEQIESTHEAFEAGATIAHCHVRDDEGKPTSDPERFAALKEGLEKHCPGLIVQLSTGGRSGAGQARGGMLPLRPDMASLAVGSNNFPTRVYENPPDLVDWLAAEMLANNVKPEIEAFRHGTVPPSSCARSIVENSQVRMMSCPWGRTSYGNTRSNSSGSASHLPASCGVSDEVAQVSITSSSPWNPPGTPRCDSS